MAAITAFPEDILPEKFGNYAVDRTYTAGGEIIAGQAVKLDADGKVVAGTAGSAIIGVALYGAAAGGLVAIRIQGAVYAANGDGATAIAGGARLAAGALGGFVAATDGVAFAQAVEAIPGGGTGLIKIL